MTRVTVLAGFGSGPVDPDPVWTDITGWVVITGSGIAISRGASDELQQTQTGTCVLALDNQDGRFTPGNASSPYYPYVRRLTPLWVRVTVPQGPNWLTSPGFEDGLDGWAAGAVAPASVVQDGTHYRSGTQAALIAWATAGTGGTWQTTVYGLTIGAVYTASAYVYVPAGSPAVRLAAGGVDGALSTATGSFVRISVTWTATAASHTVAVTTGTTSPASGTQCWLDDVMVNDGAAAAAYDGAAAVVVDRFYGPVASWPKTRKGLLIGAALQASDVFAWMGRQPALAPMLAQEVLLHSPVAYYPLAEGSDAASGGDFSGASQTALTAVSVGSGGTLSFGQGTGPAATGQTAPVFTPASATAGVYLTATWTSPVGPTFGGPIPQPSYVFEVWFSTTVKGRVIADWATLLSASYTSAITLLLDASTGQLAIERHDDLAVTTTTVATGTLADGVMHHVVVDELARTAWVDGVSYAASITGTHDLQVLTVGARAGARLWSGTIAHVALYVATGGVPSGADIAAADYPAGATGWAGEDADTRVQRLAAYAGLPAPVATGEFSAVASQGQLGSSALAHMREVEATESGRLIAARSGPGLLFQARTVRYNPVPAFALSYPDTETDQMDEADDDQKMVNIVVASRPGGAVQRVLDAASVATFGPYQPPDLSLLKTADNEVVDAARWRVARYAQPYSEIRQVQAEAYTLPAATYAAILQADVSTVVTLTDLPADSPAPSATLTVEGYTETITQRRHVIDLRTSRTDTDAVWVLDDTTYSVLGSTTRLAY